MDKEKQFRLRLKQAGERISSPRLAVFRALVRFGPLSIAELITRLADTAIDPSTIYRTIALLKKLDMVHDVTGGGRRLLELSDAYGTHHHHFTCRKCGRIIDFESKKLERHLEIISERLGVTLQSHSVEMNGLCQNCNRVSKETIIP